MNEESALILLITCIYRNWIKPRVDAGLTVSKIVEDVNILKVISWIQEAWRGVEDKTIKNCFEKCGFTQPDSRLEESVDEEFEELISELAPTRPSMIL